RDPRVDHQEFLRARAGAARNPRQDRDRAPDRTGDHAAGRRGVRVVRAEGDQSRDAGKARSAREDVQRPVPGQGQEPSARIAPPGDDRTQVTMPRSIALTLGEPAGIGPDLPIALWRRRTELDLPPFYVIGDRNFLARRANLLGTPIAFATSTPREAGATFASALPVVDVGT